MDPAARRAQEEADAAFARSLAETEQEAAYPPRPSAAAQQQGGAQGNFSLRTGQKARVSLHHTATRSHIGETFIASYLSPSEVRFDVCTPAGERSGKSLRVSDTGLVDFALPSHPYEDPSVKFRFEVTGEGNVYLLSVAHSDKLNSGGQRGWYLALSDGRLIGNSHKCALSQWLLVSAEGGAAPTTTQPLPQQPPAPFPYGNRPPPAAAAASSSGFGLFGWSGGGSGGERDGYSAVSSVELVDQSINPLQAPPPPAPTQTPSARTAVPPQPQTQPHMNHQHQHQHQQRSAASGSGLSILSLSVDEQLAWLSTRQGQAFLETLPTPHASLLQAQGSLRGLMHRPDWPWVAEEYAEFLAQQGGSHRDYDQEAARFALSEKQQREFFEEGFTILRGVVPVEAVDRARRLVAHWSQPTASPSGHNQPRGRVITHGPQAGTGCRIELLGAILKDHSILQLYSNTPLRHVSQLLIGAGEVADVGSASVHVYYPSLEPGSSTLPEGPTVKGGEWLLEGFDGHGGHSPYALLLAIPLDDLSVPDAGQLGFHAGSHIFLQEAVKGQIAAGLSLFSQPGSEGKPVLAEAPAALLSRGDAVLVQQKVAITYFANRSLSEKSYAFFKLRGLDHEAFREIALEFPFAEFNGADILDGPKEKPNSDLLDFSVLPTSPAPAQTTRRL